MFVHHHPYPPFLFDGVEKIIVGTLPPPRFSTGELREGDVDFCYGSRNGQLWPILDRIFELGLRFETTEAAVRQRMDFLRERRIGICDIVESAQREKIDASDLGMRNLNLRNLMGYLRQYDRIQTLLFTGGNSKNGPEYLFRKHAKNCGVVLERVSDSIPRIHRFTLPGTVRVIRTISLTAPSGAANRAVGSLDDYKRRKRENPDFTTLDFRVLQYKAYF